jgi:hypothetical protein
MNVLSGATETVSKPFIKLVNSIAGKGEIKKLQKRAILGTAHVLR